MNDFLHSFYEVRGSLIEGIQTIIDSTRRRFSKNIMGTISLKSRCSSFENIPSQDELIQIKGMLGINCCEINDGKANSYEEEKEVA